MMSPVVDQKYIQTVTPMLSPPFTIVQVNGNQNLPAHSTPPKLRDGGSKIGLIASNQKEKKT